MSEVVILGGGLAGLGAANGLKKEFEIFEKESRVGGLCRSENVNGFLFDYSIKILYTKNEEAKDIILGSLGDNRHTQGREAWVYFKGGLTRYPWQAFTYGMPPEVIKDCVMGVIKANYDKDKKEPKNFEEWIYSVFGDGIAKHFMMPYNEKIWTVKPKEMTHDWIAYRVPVVKYEDVLEGAIKPPAKDYGPNAVFWYPTEGGIETLPRNLAKKFEGKITLDKEASKIDWKNKKVAFKDGDVKDYKFLVSTLPLPEVIKMMDDVPKEVQDATNGLRYNTVLCVGFGIDRANISDKHWVYFPEKKYSFYRINYPMNFAKSCAPEGKSSIMAEVAFKKNDDIDIEATKKKVWEDLLEAGIVKKDDKILAELALKLDYAYIIYDHNHKKNVGIVHKFLKENNIYPCGRFGEWEYFNMDHSIMSGMKAADEINKKT